MEMKKNQLILVAITAFMLFCTTSVYGGIKAEKFPWNAQKRAMAQKGPEYPIIADFYTFEEAIWKLQETDSLKHDQMGNITEVKSVISGSTIKNTYDQHGNLLEELTLKNDVNESKKVYSYDPIVKDYRITQIYYAWTANAWVETYNHLKEIKREGNNLTAINIWAIREGDSALNRSYSMVYNKDTAIAYYDMNRFDGANDTAVAFTNMVWQGWKGQLTEDDFFNNNQLVSAVNFAGKEKESGFSTMFFEDGFQNVISTEVDRTVRSFTKFNDYGSYGENTAYYMVEGTDTILAEGASYVELYDNHSNIMEIKAMITNENMEMELAEDIKYINTYDSKDRFGGYTTIMYNMETKTYDSTDKVIFKYAGSVNSEKNASLIKIGVYPNPAHDYIKFSVKGNFERMRIYDLSGRMLYQGNICGGTSVAGSDNVSIEGNYNVSSLEPGMYVLELSGKSGVATQKFVRSGK